jgi:predicted polyphosphate/ATP-dependent NAD kinase
MTGPAAPVLGLVVNPVAGLGGRVGLKGTDGAETLRLARARGAVPESSARAAAALRRFATRWPAASSQPFVLCGPGEMGMAAVAEAGLQACAVGTITPGTTTGADTALVAALLAEAGVELLLFAGGDGTARDIEAGLAGASIPVLGIPAGVKIHSAVFATSPAAAGEGAADFLIVPLAQRRSELREVLDLDEEAYRRGEIAPRVWGELLVPADRRRVQARKAPSPATEAAAAAAIGAEVAAQVRAGSRLILGPGSTVRAVAERLGVAKTLVGVDVVDVAPGPRAVLIAADAAETDLRRLATREGCQIVVTPIGGQGFLFGRGNQPISPAVIRGVLAGAGRAGIIVVATPAKLAALGTRPLLLDTGDPALDRELAGHVLVITGLGERSMLAMRPA